MAVLVTGASGAIGSALVDRLVDAGRPPRIASRDPGRLRARRPQLDTVELDVLREETLAPALAGVRAAYYLVHSMEPGAGGDFSERDAAGARNFAAAARAAGVERVIYLGGLGEEGRGLSEHLASRHETGRILAQSGPPLLEFRAAMVVSRDSASYQMLSDLVNRLPAMLVPRWVDTPSQPIALDDVLAYLVAGLDVALEEPRTIVEIGGPEVTSYREMIRTVASQRGRRPLIVGVPLLTPRLSSYWCGLTTSVPAALARPLIEGMSAPLLVRDGSARRLFPAIEPMSFGAALERVDAGERISGP
jgi:uncharacterized protein YbjT (DUF2867 family)